MIEMLEGIVLNDKDYGETSKILTIITKEHGLVSVISKGCKNMKSTLRSVSDKLVYGNFNMYYKEDKLSTLVSVDVIDSLKNIRLDYDKISYASYLLELAEQVMKQHVDNNIYDILISALLKINDGYDAIVISDIVSLKYLDYLGVMPTLSSDAGGYLCNKCRTNEPLVNEKTIKLIRMFYYVDINKITKLEVSEVVKKEIHSFIDRYYDRYTGLYFRTKKLMKVSE